MRITAESKCNLAEKREKKFQSQKSIQQEVINFDKKFTA